MSTASRTIMLTGANGGIGKAIAKRLADDGYKLVLTDLVPCDAMIEAQGIGDSVVHTAPCDLSSAEDVEKFLQAIPADIRIDALINNAAHMAMIPFDQMGPKDLETFYKIDIQASFMLSQFASMHMRERGWGRIINMVSGSAWAPSPFMTGYITVKMGLVGLTRSMAVELAPHGICVNAITPALTRHEGMAALPEPIWEIDRNRQAIKRTAVPDDIVGAISFLVSDDSAFMTGQTMVVDGGMVFP